MESIFTRIVKGEIPSYKVAEDDHFYAFLDIQPLAEGHTLVVPKKETDYIFDIDDKEYRDFFSFARKVAKAIDEVIECKKVGIAVVGLEVAHAHIHLVPLNSIGDLDFGKKKLDPGIERMSEIAANLREAYTRLFP
jgi:histidine triad (HIT) family protein